MKTQLRVLNFSRRLTLTKKVVLEGLAMQTMAMPTTRKRKKKKASRELTDVYTRCCHLREIIPIKATLRQLEGYTDTPCHFYVCSILAPP